MIGVTDGCSLIWMKIYPFVYLSITDMWRAV